MTNLGQSPRKQKAPWTPTQSLLIILALSSSLLLNAWWHIQAVRLGYQAYRLNTSLSDVKSESETLQQELARLSSLSRLEEWAKIHEKSKCPGPTQLVFLTDPFQNHVP